MAMRPIWRAASGNKHAGLRVLGQNDAWPTFLGPRARHHNSKMRIFIIDVFTMVAAIFPLIVS